MLIRQDGFVYTDQIRPGMVAHLKNGLTVIGVKNEYEAQLRMFHTNDTPEYILHNEVKLIDQLEKILSLAPDTLISSIDQYSIDFMEHASLLEERAFEAGYMAAKQKENADITSELSSINQIS
ncbi:hypothetical protein [Fictibacillus norfolkensis]|uniref:Uncharacterized protein n=1 Tax=Fictibacillus norfolkensis TaxID=2762233 RepID=A0ABR8ST61_9BACL|nr:hypothetical protein [Fictibacillus norfolkensis]MBD7966269.1 hypothetical protein [Fictibacillus norfolkensis]